MVKTQRILKEVLERQVAEILPSREGLQRLMKKRKIRVYLGIDPTGANLHLGHTIALRKLQQFAGLGHEAILVVGTGTVLAGDPSQRDKTRPKITKKEIAENMRAWRKQASKVLDFRKVKVRHNGDWLLKLGLADLLAVASNISLVQLYQRDMFQRRIARGDTVWTHEALYPLLQGYDSVAMDVDLEIGGTDQVFNMLVGRELQRKMKNREKFVLTVPMVLGLDGKPMSKTSGNTVNIADPPKEMYGKVMTLRDELVPQYFEFLTAVAKKDVTTMKKNLSPRDFKGRLAREIVFMYHGETKTAQAEKEFNRVFRERKLPSGIQEVRIQGTPTLVEVLVQAGFASSKSEARRIIQQGGVKFNGKVQKDPSTQITSRFLGIVMQVGKRRFAKVG